MTTVRSELLYIVARSCERVCATSPFQNALRYKSCGHFEVANLVHNLEKTVRICSAQDIKQRCSVACVRLPSSVHLLHDEILKKDHFIVAQTQQRSPTLQSPTAGTLDGCIPRA